jgi:hypothetical protein
MEVVNILPTPVAIIPCPFHDKVKENILTEIEEQKLNQLSYNTNSRALSHIGHYSVLQNDVKFGRFRNWCEQQAEYYAKEIKGDYIQETVQVTDSWINVADKGGYQHPHYHSNSYLSAVYYVNYDNEKHISTNFTREELIVNEGELIIFPAQIIHGYDDNQFQDRVTLSMNMMPTIVTNGDYGWRCVNLNKAEREKAFDTKENLDLTKE